jgi:hypothetical protein
MTIHVYQIAISIISAIMIYKGIASYIKGETGQTFLKVSVRVIVWGGMAFIAIFPEFTRIVAKVIGIEGNINAVILTGFLLIFLMMFKLLSAIEKLEQGLSEVTRKEALNEIDKKQ